MNRSAALIGLSMPGRVAQVVAWIDLNPIGDLRDLIANGARDAWQQGMFALWESGLWLLETAFGLLDEFVIPDLADPGLTGIYQLCVWLSAALATLLGLGQLGLSAWRRDGAGLGRLAIGAAQYGAALACWVVVGVGLVAATGELASGILGATLHVDSFGGFAAGAGLPTKMATGVGATVLGLLSILLLIPAALGFVVVMLVREAALLVLVVTLPIAAAGAVGEATRAWLWKAVRWFLATCLMAPLMALVLGVGVQLTRAAFPDDGAGSTAPSRGSLVFPGWRDGQVLPGTQTDPRTAIGMAVVGCVILVIACFCPLVLFRLLAFVDPGTGSGAAFRTSLAAADGLSGLLGGRRGGGSAGGSGAGHAESGGGRPHGEVDAEAMTQARFAGALGALGARGAVGAAGGALGAGLAVAGRVAQAGARVSGDVLGTSGVGASSNGYETYAPATLRRRPPSPSTVSGSGSSGRGGAAGIGPGPDAAPDHGVPSGPGGDGSAGGGSGSPATTHGHGQSADPGSGGTEPGYESGLGPWNGLPICEPKQHGSACAPADGASEESAGASVRGVAAAGEVAAL